jgi:predicted negative regulator of RcsB-dependent stress response
MAKKRKISRKELLKKPDEFITLSTRTFLWVKANAPKVILIGIGVVLLAGIYFGYATYRTRQEKLAHEKYFAVLESTDTDQKLKDLVKIIKDYPGTRAAFESRVTAGNLYYQKNDFTRAVSSYQSALNHRKVPSGFKTLIEEDLAYAYEQKGDLSLAAKTFSVVFREKENLFKEDALLGLARVSDKMGKKAEAKNAYQLLLKSFPQSIYAQMVKERLAGL